MKSLVHIALPTLLAVLFACKSNSSADPQAVAQMEGTIKQIQTLKPSVDSIAQQGKALAAKYGVAPKESPDLDPRKINGRAYEMSAAIANKMQQFAESAQGTIEQAQKLLVDYQAGKIDKATFDAQSAAIDAERQNIENAIARMREIMARAEQEIQNSPAEEPAPTRPSERAESKRK